MKSASNGASYYANNNFDLIRLIAAIQVVAVHVIQHLRITPLDRFSAVITYFPGVPAFFFVSGFLIHAAWKRNPDIRVFYANRAYRILPALWASVALASITLFVFFDRGILAVNAKQLTLWIIGQATIGQVWTPSFLRAYGIGTVNGSLWTIPVELTFYAVLPALAWLFARYAKPHRILPPLIVAAFALNYGIALWHPSNAKWILGQKLIMTSPIPWFGMFFTGMLAQENIDRVYAIVGGRVWFFLAVFVGVSALSAIVPAYPVLGVPLDVIGGGNRIGILNFVAICGLVLSAAYSYRGVSDRVLRRNDLSYGTYIAHMIVVNVVAQLGIFGLTGGAIVVLTVAPLAAVSWFFLEKPMLARRKASLYRH